MSLTNARAVLAELLFELGAIKFASQPGEFKLKLHDKHPEAPLSSIYLNLRTERHPVNPGPLTDEVMDLIGDLFLELLGNGGIEVFDCLADIPDAGGPFGDQLARAGDIDGIHASRVTLHKERLPDGSRRITDEVEGVFEEGDVCVLVDDLITGADTKLEAIAALEDAGLVVKDIVVVVDRLQGGTQQLEAAGYRLWSAFGLDELLAFYVERGFIGQPKADEVLGYLVANQA